MRFLLSSVLLLGISCAPRPVGRPSPEAATTALASAQKAPPAAATAPQPAPPLRNDDRPTTERSERDPILRLENLLINPEGPAPWDVREDDRPLPLLEPRFRLVRTIEVGAGYLDDAILSADGSKVAVASEDTGLLSMFAIESGRRLVDVRYPDFAQFDPLALVATTGSRFLIGGKSGTFEGTFGESELRPFRSEATDTLYYFPAARLLAAIERRVEPQSGRGVLSHLGADGRPEPSAAALFHERPDGLAFARGGEWLAVVYYPANRVFLYDLKLERTLRSFDAPEFAGSVALTKDGRYLAVGGAELRLYDTTTGALVDRDGKYGNNIDTVVFSPDERLLVTSAYEGKARSYAVDFTTSSPKLGKPQILAHRGTANVYALHFTPDGRRLVTSSGDKTIKVWERKTARSKDKD